MCVMVKSPNGEKCCKSHLTLHILPFPSTLCLLRDRNLNRKQPLTIYFYLTMSSFCLQEHPNHSTPFLRTVNRVPVLSLSPSETINGDGKPTLLTAYWLPTEQHLEHPSPADWLSLGYSRSQGTKLTFPFKKGATLVRRCHTHEEVTWAQASLPIPSYICKHLFS